MTNGYRNGVLVVALVGTSRRLRAPGILLRRECSLFIWSGQVDLIPLHQALVGLLLTLAGDHCSSTDEGSVMTGEMGPALDVGGLGPA